MSKKAEMEKLDRAIKDGEIRLMTVNSNIVLLTREINTLVELEAKLEENVACLKKRNIIAIAIEFRKSKDDLKRAKARLSLAKGEKEAFAKASSALEKALDRAKEDLDKLKKISDNNVVQGKFRRKE